MSTEDRLSQLEEDVNILRSKVNDSEYEIDRLATRISSLENDIYYLRSTVNSLENKRHW